MFNLSIIFHFCESQTLSCITSIAYEQNIKKQVKLFQTSNMYI